MINQRRVVQEVYDQRVLHKLLGVDPRPVVVTMTMDAKPAARDHKETGTSNRNGSIEVRTVAKAVWSVSSGSDTESQRGDDDENVVYLGSKRKDQEDGEIEEDSGRYDIGRKGAAKAPPTKRQKTGPRKGVSVYFVDGDSDGASDEDENSVVLDEEAEYDLEEPSGTSEKPASQSNDRDKRRSYWLSKGIGSGKKEDTDSD